VKEYLERMTKEGASREAAPAPASPCPSPAGRRFDLANKNSSNRRGAEDVAERQERKSK